MITTLAINNKQYHANLLSPLDISMPLNNGTGPSAWYVEPLEIKPVVTDRFKGDVNLGGAVNFRNIFFNPHGHGTHTECVGHISREFNSINKTLTQFFFASQLISVYPEIWNEDKIITAKQLRPLLEKGIEALIIRTLPNNSGKLSKNYSSTNPPYIEMEVAGLLNEYSVKHLLIDTPSVDREEDDGKLLMHHAFWNYPEQKKSPKTITEMIFVKDSITDGLYLLNLQIAPFENDASPSKPVLFKLIQK